MKLAVFLAAVCVLGVAAPRARAQADSTVSDSTAAVAMAEAAESQGSSAPRNVFYGGTVGLTFGDYTSISIEPMMGVKLNRRVGVGVKAVYEYVKDDRYNEDVTGHNFGGSVFGRLFAARSLYAHAEFAYMGYKYEFAGIESDREWVPFVLLGGGVVKPIGPNLALTAEVLFDVLQSDKSPYDDWEPFVSVGVVVGH